MTSHELQVFRQQVRSSRRADVDEAVFLAFAQIGGINAFRSALAEAKTLRIRRQNCRARRQVAREVGR